MENYISYFLMLNNNSITINTDILETNVVNIILLLALLFVVIRNFLTETLGARKNKIVVDVENAERRLSDSTMRYQESERQWAQIQIIVENIYTQANQSKQNMLKEKCTQAKEELSKKFLAATNLLQYREQNTFDDIIKEVSERAIQRVISKLQIQLNDNEQANIIDKKIELLGENY